MERRAAGAAQTRVSFGLAMVCLIPYEIWQGKTSERSPKRGGGSRREEEERRSPTVPDLTGDTRRYCGASSRNSVGLKRNWRERKREAREVIGGYL
jgi:hypothetical protein